MGADETAVLAANEEFYRAFGERDIARMDQLWACVAPVACIHPGWAPRRSQVLESWRGILEGPSPPEIGCFAAQVYVYGDLALVICNERLGDDADLIATNVFVREADSGGVVNWKLVHHQAGPAPPAAPRVAASTVH